MDLVPLLRFLGGPRAPTEEEFEKRYFASVEKNRFGQKVRTGPKFEAWLEGSVSEGPNETNYSDRSSLTILANFRNFR